MVMRIMGKVMVIFAALMLLFELAYAFPIPPKSKITRDETVEIGPGQERRVVFCETDLSAEEALSFYQREMVRQGYSIFMQLKNVGMYKKGDELLVTTVMPGAEGEKTSLIVTATNIKEDNQAGTTAQVCEDVPSLPVYPHAQCVGSMRIKNKGALTLRYSVPDDVGETVSFYITQMPQSGWKLEREVDVSDYLSKIKEKGAAGATTGSAGAGMNFNVPQGQRLLVFRAAGNKRCTISLMSSPIGKGTFMNIIYEEKAQE